jgi:phosphopantetheinyl transferase
MKDVRFAFRSIEQTRDWDYSSLPHDIQKRAGEISHDATRWAFQASRYFILGPVLRSIPLDPTNVRLDKLASGQLVLKRVSDNMPAISLSLSHTDGALAFVWSSRPGVSIGIDLERQARVIAFKEMGRQFFGPIELDDLERQGASSARLLAVLLWTAKEAVSKGMGLGLRAGFSSIEFDTSWISSDTIERFRRGQLGLKMRTRDQIWTLCCQVWNAHVVAIALKTDEGPEAAQLQLSSPMDSKPIG